MRIIRIVSLQIRKNVIRSMPMKVIGSIKLRNNVLERFPCFENPHLIWSWLLTLVIVLPDCFYMELASISCNLFAR